MSDSNNIQKIHMNTHSNDKLFKCDHENCDKKYSQAHHLKRHKMKHSDEKPFKCDNEGCSLEFFNPSHLKRHKLTHSGNKSYKCDHENCGRKFYTLDGLEIHKRVHSGYKPYGCELCNYKCSYLSNLKRHKRTHIDHNPYECELCEYKCSDYSRLKRHMKIHSGERPYKCETCDYECAESGNLKKHMKTHTIEGQIRRKKQENNLNNKLKDWEFLVDTETTINAKKGECLKDTNRYFSRIDFHVINCTNANLFIECDEYQHYWYELSCEFSRMSDIRASLMKAGNELPIYWIRYNPNGKYHIGGDQVHICLLYTSPSPRD